MYRDKDGNLHFDLPCNEYGEVIKSRESWAQKSGFDYEVFGREVRERPYLQVRNRFKDVPIKREILKKAGYDALDAEGGRHVRIEDATDARIGLAFMRTYRQYQNRTRSRLCPD